MLFCSTLNQPSSSSKYANLPNDETPNASWDELAWKALSTTTWSGTNPHWKSLRIDSRVIVCPRLVMSLSSSVIRTAWARTDGSLRNGMRCMPAAKASYPSSTLPKGSDLVWLARRAKSSIVTRTSPLGSAWMTPFWFGARWANSTKA